MLHKQIASFQSAPANWYQEAQRLQQTNLDNWLNKSAAAEDIISGIEIHDISKFPTQDKLIDQQKRRISDASFESYHNPSFYADLFLRYPKHAYYSLYRLKDLWLSMGQWTPYLDKLGKLYRTKQSLREDSACRDLPSGLPEEMYRELAKRIRFWAEPNLTQVLILERQNYPDWFVQEVEKAFPVEAQAAQRFNPQLLNRILLREIQQGSYGCRGQFALGFTSKPKGEFDLEAVRHRQTVFQSMLSLYPTVSRWTAAVKGSGFDDRYAIEPQQWVQNLDAAIQAVKNKTDLPASGASPLAVYHTTTGLGKVTFVYLLGRAILPNQLTKLRQIIATCTTPVSLSRLGKYDIESLNEDRKYSQLPPINLKPDLWYLRDEQGNVWPGEIWANQSHQSYKNTQLESLVDLASNCWMPNRYKAEATWQWYQQEKQRHQKNLPHFYVELMQNGIFVKLAEKAGQTFADVHISHFQETDDDQVGFTYGRTNPAIRDVILKIWSEIPQNIRDAQARIKGENRICLWFRVCSGLYRCEDVLRWLKEYPRDGIKISSGINCLGMTPEMRQRIVGELREAEEAAKDTVVKSWPEFLKSEQVRKVSISESPALLAHVKQMLGRMYAPDDKRYNSTTQAYGPAVDVALQELIKMPIYLVEAAAINGFFGEEAARLAGLSPSDANGIFINDSKYSDEPFVLVFTKQFNQEANVTNKVMGDVFQIESELKDVSPEEEQTLWHEVAHAVVERTVGAPTRGYDRDQTVSDWLQSPSEILAVSYGNLGHIRTRLQELFQKIFPFPQRITEGLLAHIRADLIQTFPDEFHGMTQAQAETMLRDVMSDFDEETQRTASEMTQAEQVKLMTEIFTEFLMGKSMRGKVQSLLEQELTESGRGGQKKVQFYEPPVVPETYEFKPLAKDTFVAELEQRADYQQFLKAAQAYFLAQYQANQNRPMPIHRRYGHRSQPWILRQPRELSDVCSLLFDAPSDIDSVDLRNTNSTFADLVPPTLLADVRDLVNKEKLVRRGKPPIPDTNQPVSPDEAEEAGRFISEMDKDYGQNWMWVANTKSWYKTAMQSLAGVQQLEMPLKLPPSPFPTSTLPPESDWHAARIINQIIRDNPDELRNYEEYAWQDGATDAQRSKKGLQAYKEELSSRYGEVLETLQNMPDPVPVYRAINVEVGQTLDSIQEAIDHNGFGVYWSYRPDGAIPHQGGRGRTITLYAYAPSQIVDWRRSLELNLACPDEMELRLFPGRNLIVYRINADGTGRRTDKDWNVAWRGKT